MPAESEIVIEGTVPADMVEMEGAFGEFPGYMAQRDFSFFMDVTAITTRKKPIYLSIISQMPPSESTIMQSLTNAAVLLKMLREDVGDPNVVDVFIDPTFGGVLAHGIVAIKAHHPGHGRRIGHGRKVRCGPGGAKLPRAGSKIPPFDI